VTLSHNQYHIFHLQALAAALDARNVSEGLRVVMDQFGEYQEPVTTDSAQQTAFGGRRVAVDERTECYKVCDAHLLDVRCAVIM
jgi:hypothetical protein